jgi:xylulose-5-phosphate/fructose-6-phosphate phosphoketolase
MAHFKDHLKNSILESTRRYAFEYGTDKPEITDWKWPFGTGTP